MKFRIFSTFMILSGLAMLLSACGGSGGGPTLTGGQIAAGVGAVLNEGPRDTDGNCKLGTYGDMPGVCKRETPN